MKLQVDLFQDAAGILAHACPCALCLMLWPVWTDVKCGSAQSLGTAKSPLNSHISFEQPSFNLHFQGSGRNPGPVVYSAVDAVNGHEFLYR